LALGVDGVLVGFGDASAGLEAVLSDVLEDEASVLAFPSLFVSEVEAAPAPSLGLFEAVESPELAAGAAALLPYPSAYQPPPFSKKPVPPEMRRLALFFPQETQVFSAASLIDCSASQWWPHASHAYS
jgi:hypothetical protein